MTVSELIELLSRYPPDAEVNYESDSTNPNVHGLELIDHGTWREVLIS